MNPLFDSRKFDLVNIIKNGKKLTPSTLIFRGSPTAYGMGMSVLAVEHGAVVAVGEPTIEEDGYRRDRQGERVKVKCRDGVTMTYGNLESCSVNVGDEVRVGQMIGRTIGTQVVKLEFWRTGRRIDGCNFLGIECVQARFYPEEMDAERMVAEACGLDGGIVAYISLHPEHKEFWNRIANRLALVTNIEDDDI